MGQVIDMAPYHEARAKRQVERQRIERRLQEAMTLGRTMVFHKIPLQRWPGPDAGEPQAKGGKTKVAEAEILKAQARGETVKILGMALLDLEATKSFVPPVIDEVVHYERPQRKTDKNNQEGEKDAADPTC